MNYVALTPPTRAAEQKPIVDVDLFEDRGIPVTLNQLQGQGFVLEGMNTNGGTEGTMIWIPGLFFENLLGDVYKDKDLRNVALDDEDGQ